MLIWTTSTLARAGAVRAWLTRTGSLSEHLRGACGDGAFRVERLMQCRARAWPDERRVLGLPADALPLVREVLLFCGDTPVVFARSLAAERHLDGPWRALRGLGARPLATMLFAEPLIVRGALECRRLGTRDPLYRRAARAVDGLPGNLWARRSVFRRDGAPLLVSEVFLPGVPTP